MNRLTVAKGVVSLIISSGCGTIVKTIIRDNVVPNSKFQQITIGVATFAIGFVVSDAVSGHTNDMIDTYVAAYQAAKKEQADARRQL